MKTLALLAALALPAAAGPAGHGPKAPASKEFDLVKGLAGEWKGTGMMEGKPVDVTTGFRLTSAGSAVVETMGAGTEHEMTNVYHDVGGALTMTHYCAMGNAPVLKAAKTDGKSLSLTSVPANGIDPKKTPHMRSVVYELVDQDHMKATWTAANMGKDKEGPAVFTYQRVK